MMIGCTRKAAKAINKVMYDAVDKEEDLYCWHMMEFGVYGDKILLCMNDATRFPLFLHGGGTITDVDQRFLSVFKEAMEYLRIPKEAVNAYLSQGEIQYCKAWNRSILAQMSELAHVYKANIMNGTHRFYRDVDASIDYSEIPCLKFKMYPKDKMHEAMMRIYGHILGVM